MFEKSLEILRCPVGGEEATLRASYIFERADDGEILEGILECEASGHWYRIEKGIADLVRDELREVEIEREFLTRHRDKLPASIIEDGKPFGLEGAAPPRNEEDQKIVDEGRHWGRFMRRFWDVGDRSIFDIRVKGTHPTFYVKGVLEPDERDRHHAWGFFPNAVGRLLFESMDKFSGKMGVDIGCGGGQFGLEAANRGVNVFSFDPSFEEVELGRLHARETGVKNIEYIRAEPAHPPFAKSSFDLLLAKDSLHHVPNLMEIFPRLLETGTADATFICHEHFANGKWKSRLMNRIAGPAIRKIRSRYPTHEIPEELLRDSANEDVAADEIIPLLKKHFRHQGHQETLFLAMELEMFSYYAFGKRRWVSTPVYIVSVLLDEIFRFLGDRQHIAFVGRRKAK